MSRIRLSLVLTIAIGLGPFQAMAQTTSGTLVGVVLAQGEVESAAALALCNAVRGILPVASLGARAWAPHPALAELQERVAMAYPMFSEAGAAA